MVRVSLEKGQRKVRERLGQGQFRLGQGKVTALLFRVRFFWAWLFCCIAFNNLEVFNETVQLFCYLFLKNFLRRFELNLYKILNVFQVFPFVSGYVFTSPWGPNGVLELTLIVCAVQCSLFTLMWFISRKKIEESSQDIFMQQKKE